MTSSASDPDKLTIQVYEGDDVEKTTAKHLTGPFISNAYALSKFGKGCIGEVKLDNIVSALADSATAIKANNLAQVEDLLISQAMTLNIMFGELSRRAAANMSEYIEAHKAYMGLALKAQNQSRMTLETLSAIKNPPVVYARQANIAHGPQQVNNGAAAPTRAKEKQNAPNRLLEQSDDKPVDTGATTETGGGNSDLEAVGMLNGSKDESR